MGKQRKLRSSMKALQDAITSFRPAVGSPLCIQPAKTGSFRDLITSFNSAYYTPPTSYATSSSSNLCHPFFHHHNLNQASTVDIRPIPNSGEEMEESISSSSTATIGASTSTCSSCLSSSSLITATADDSIEPEEALPSGKISSKRFFFTPCTTKSIMGEAPELEIKDSNETGETGEEEEAEVEEEINDMVEEEEEKEEESTNEGLFCITKESITMAMASKDPYVDFRRSMEEMVEAHGLIGDWSALQELLHRYLRLNEKKTHKFIVLAFMDLLMNLSKEEEDNNDNNKYNHKNVSSSSPVPLFF